MTADALSQTPVSVYSHQQDGLQAEFWSKQKMSDSFDVTRLFPHTECHRRSQEFMNSLKAWEKKGRHKGREVGSDGKSTR